MDLKTEDNQIENTKAVNYELIASNTMFLYIRMITIMLVSFFTIRIVLDALGVGDFGVYSIIFSISSIFVILNGTFMASTQRFLTFELAKNDIVRLKSTFSMSLLMHTVFALIFVIVAETFGIWLLNNKLNIPVDRLDSAFWAAQFVILAAVISIVQVPYVALIIAHEKMKVYSYISILEAALKLLAVYLLLMVSYDRLIMHSFLISLSSIVIAIYYIIYCLKYYPESHFKFAYDKKILLRMMNFSGWNVFSTVGFIVANQGIAVLLNIYFGPLMNAAHAIALKVSSALSLFVNNFQTAVTPQITKLYAKNELLDFNKLIRQNSKYSFLLLWILTLPAIINLSTIISLWLIEVPQYSGVFTRLLIVYALLYSLMHPLSMGINATGRNKFPQIAFGIILISAFLISYILLENGYSPDSPFIVSIVIWFLHFSMSVFFLNKYTNFEVAAYFKEAVIPIVIIVLFSAIPTYYFFIDVEDKIIKLVSVTIFSFVLNLFLIYFIAMDKKARIFLIKKIKNIKNKGVA